MIKETHFEPSENPHFTNEKLKEDFEEDLIRILSVRHFSKL